MCAWQPFTYSFSPKAQTWDLIYEHICPPLFWYFSVSRLGPMLPFPLFLIQWYVRLLCIHESLKLMSEPLLCQYWENGLSFAMVKIVALVRLGLSCVVRWPYLIIMLVQLVLLHSSVLVLLIVTLHTFQITWHSFQIT